MVFPNKHMRSPIQTESPWREAGSEAFSSTYGRERQASREKDVPLQVNYDKLQRTQDCECEISNLEIEKAETEIKRRKEVKVLEAKMNT